MGGWKLSIYENEENSMKRQLFMNGPSILTFDGHAVLYCAYDETGLYYRDSYNSSTPVRITWSNWPSRRRPGKNEYCYLSFPYKNT